MHEIRITEVAAMLGKELGEKFKIKDLKSGKIYVAYFHRCGLKVYDGSSDSWKSRRDIITRLIFGTAVVIDEDRG